jgi:hypothetical protein
MDEIKTLRRISRQVPEPHPSSLARNRLALLRRIEDGVPPGREASRRTRLPRLVLMSVAAMALAIAAIAAQTVRVGERAPMAEASAAQVLQRAADIASRANTPTPGAGQYLYAKSREVSLTSSGGWRVLVAHDREQWLAADGRGMGLIRERADAPRQVPGLAMPPREVLEKIVRQGDSARWVNGCPGGPAASTGSSSSHADKLAMAKLNCEPAAAASAASLLAPTYPYMRQLPTDPQRLLRLIYEQNAAAYPSTPGKPSLDQRAFDTAGGLMRQPVMPPELAAAVFEAAAKIPGVTVVKDAVDAAGRHGVAVARGDAGIRNELIFDRETSSFLGGRSVVVADNPELGKAGTVIESTALLGSGIVDALDQRP